MEYFAAMHAEIREVTKKSTEQDMEILRLKHEQATLKQEHATETAATKIKIEELERTIKEMREKTEEHKAYKEKTSNLSEEVAEMKANEARWKRELEQLKIKTDEENLKKREQLQRLTKEVEEQKSWVEVTKKNKPQEDYTPRQDLTQEVKNILSEEKDRLRRANNMTLRGIPEKDNESPDELRQTVQTTLQEKFSQPGLQVLTARRVGKANEKGRGRLIILSMDQARKRSLLSTKTECLKGTTLFLDDDRTPKQQEEYRKKLEDRWLQRKGKTTQPANNK
jgi:hypothetical protein